MFKTLLRLLVIFSISMFVFDFFYGILTLPLAVIETEKLKPILYGYAEDMPQTIYVFTETKAGYVVYAYWAYWADHRKPEYEPFAVVYNPKGEIYAFAARVHWQWRVKFTGVIQEADRVIVYFLAETHTPLNTQPPQDTTLIYYTPQSIQTQPEPIDWWSLTALSEKPSEALRNAVLWSTVTALGLSVILFPKTFRKLVYGW